MVNTRLRNELSSIFAVSRRGQFSKNAIQVRNKIANELCKIAIKSQGIPRNYFARSFAKTFPHSRIEKKFKMLQRRDISTNSHLLITFLIIFPFV